MLKIILPSVIFVCTSIPSAFAACSYPLDTTISDYAPLPSPMKAFPVISGQSASAQVIASQVNFWVAMSNSLTNAVQNSDPVGDVTVPTSGVFVVEANLSMPSVPSAGVIALEPQVILDFGTVYPNGNEKTLILYPEVVANSSTPNFIFATSESSGNLLSIPLTAPYSNIRVGVYVNQNTKQIGVTVNGTNYGYLANYAAPIVKAAFNLQGVETGIQQGDTVVGTTIGGTLITDASLISNIYPSGATDICGSVI